MQYLCKKISKMDKIIGLGNALVDALAIIEDDNILTEMQLPKGSMTLIDEDKFLKISEYFSRMKTHLANGGSAGNAIRAMACLGAGTDSSVSPLSAYSSEAMHKSANLLKSNLYIEVSDYGRSFRVYGQN